ncbi:MAG: phospholipase D-like domain-containing protein [Rivularia sp. (in: cyanobacteria)]
MSDLTKVEKTNLEKLFQMDSGYILDFSNRTFQSFILSSVEIDIYEEDKYVYFGTSKANRLRAFWDKEPNNIVGKLTLDLLKNIEEEHLNNQEHYASLTDFKDESLPYIFDQNLFDKCYKIAQRLIGNEEIEEITLAKPCFEKIEQEIIEAIDSAKFTIWVAVAWFTNQKLFKHLVAKKNQGVNVQLIILDDKINESYGINYEREFETYRFPKFGQCENILHTKFCIIDLKQVIHGSYNWTNKANYNYENITHDSNRKIAEDYAKQFIKLKNKTKMLTDNIKPDYF